MKLFFAEFRKVWGQSVFALSLAVLVGANLFFLYMGTKPQPYSPQPNAYKAFAEDISNVDASDRQAFIQGKFDELTGLRQVRDLLSGGWYENNWREKYADVLEKYEEIYKKGDYTLYTNDLDTEYLLLKEILDEVNEVSAYPEFLNELQEKANRFSGISIFQNATDNFSRANIQKTAQVYKGMAGIVQIDYAPQKGLVTALDYQLTDLILLVAMILVASLLVRQERESGLVHLVRSLPGGRLKTALAKLAVLAVTMLAVLLLMYGANLIYCGALLGLGDLTRSIQSVPALMRCTMQITVAEYLLRFFLVKWIGTSVVGIWVMLAMLWARQFFVGCCTAFFLPFVHWVIRTVIDPNSHLNIVKYANLSSLMRTNELLGNYRNLYWFQTPVSLAFVEWLTAVVYGILFLVGFCLLFCCGKLSNTAKHQLAFTKKSRKTKEVTVFGQENKKLFVLCGAALMFVLFIGYQAVETIQSEKIIDEQGFYYEEYMKQLEGSYTRETYNKLKEMQQEFLPLIKAQRKAQFTGEYDSDSALRFDILMPKMNVFERKILHGVLPYIKENPKAHLVYEVGWERLFNFRGNGDLQDTLWAGLLSCICFAGLFAFEKKGGMQRVLMSTPLGRRYTVTCKIFVGVIGAGIICLLTYLPRLIYVCRFYGLSQFFAPAMSIQAFHKVPTWISLIGILLYGFIGRLIACISMMLVMYWLSDRLGNILSALFVGALLFCLTPMLALSGLQELRWVGAYPLFHLAEMAQRSTDSVAGVMCIVIALAINWLCSMDVLDRWKGL